MGRESDQINNSDSSGDKPKTNEQGGQPKTAAESWNVKAVKQTDAQAKNNRPSENESQFQSEISGIKSDKDTKTNAPQSRIVGEVRYYTEGYEKERIQWQEQTKNLTPAGRRWLNDETNKQFWQQNPEMDPSKSSTDGKIDPTNPDHSTYSEDWLKIGNDLIKEKGVKYIEDKAFVSSIDRSILGKGEMPSLPGEEETVISFQDGEVITVSFQDQIKAETKWIEKEGHTLGSPPYVFEGNQVRAEGKKVYDNLSQGAKDSLNDKVNDLFWQANPEFDPRRNTDPGFRWVEGQKLDPGNPDHADEIEQWLKIRDTLVLGRGKEYWENQALIDTARRWGRTHGWSSSFLTEE